MDEPKADPKIVIRSRVPKFNVKFKAFSRKRYEHVFLCKTEVHVEPVREHIIYYLVAVFFAYFLQMKTSIYKLCTLRNF